jgi:hypothetical protein
MNHVICEVILQFEMVQTKKKYNKFACPSSFNAKKCSIISFQRTEFGSFINGTFVFLFPGEKLLQMAALCLPFRE